MSITAKELAKALHLSEAAVSFALNHKPGVSDRTRRLVLEKAREMGYDFTRGAPAGEKSAVRLLAYRRTGSLADEAPAFPELTEGVLRGCRRERLALELCALREDDLAGQLIQAASGCAGLILLASELSEPALAPFLALSGPLVLLDGGFDALERDCVCADACGGALLAVEALLAQRRGQPGLLRSSYPTANSERIAQGFRAALEKHGLSPARSPVLRLSPSREGAYADMRALLQAGAPPLSGYMADGDELAAGAMDALLEAGYRVPEDVALVGFGDLPVCRALTPALTSVRVPRRCLGEMAALRLAQRLSGEGRDDPPMRLEIGVTLARRGSL